MAAAPAAPAAPAALANASDDAGGSFVGEAHGGAGHGTRPAEARDKMAGVPSTPAEPPADSGAGAASSASAPTRTSARIAQNNTRKRKAEEQRAAEEASAARVPPQKRRNGLASPSKAKPASKRGTRAKAQAEQTQDTPRAGTGGGVTASAATVAAPATIAVARAVATANGVGEQAGLKGELGETELPVKKDKGKQVDRSGFGEDMSSPDSPDFEPCLSNYIYDPIDESPIDELAQDADAEEDEVLGNWWIFYPDRRPVMKPCPENPELSMSTAAAAYHRAGPPSGQPAGPSAGPSSAGDVGGDVAAESGVDVSDGVKHTDELFVCDMQISMKAKLRRDEMDDCEIFKMYKLSVARPKIENERYVYEYGNHRKREHVTYELPTNFWISRIESQDEDLPEITNADFSHLEAADPYTNAKVKSATYSFNRAAETQDSDGFVTREERNIERDLLASYMLYVRKTRRLVPFEAHSYPPPSNLGDTARRFFRAVVRPYDPDVAEDYGPCRPDKDMRTVSLYLRSKLLNQAIRQGANIKHVASVLSDYLYPVISGSISRHLYVLSDTTSEPEKSPPTGFALELYDYQKRTLNWMMRLENDERETLEIRRFSAPDINKEVLKLGPSGCYFYPKDRRFTVRNHCDARPSDVKRVRVRGGLVLDKVGSGKTVTLLALIHSNPFRSVRNIPWKQSQDRELYLPARGSLVIVPANLATQWSMEARRCLPPQTKVILLTTMVEYRKISWSDLLLADLVIVTLPFLQNPTYRARIAQIAGQSAYKISSKYSRRSLYHNLDAQQFTRELDRMMLALTCQGRAKFGGRSNCCIIERVHWHRIVIDEFHELGKNSKNVKSEEFLDKFRATFYWGVTGTPQYETSRQINEMAWYLHTDVKLETTACHQEFLNKLCRRNDPELRVPKLHYETVWVHLSANEMALYHTLQHANSLQSQLMMVNHYAITDAIVDLVGDKVMNVNQVSDILQANRAERMVALDARIRRLDDAHPKNVILVEAWKNTALPDDAEERGRVVQARREVNEFKTIRLELAREFQSLQSSYTFFQGVLDAIESCVEQTCPLCLETIYLGEEFQITNCGHVYCVECTTRLLLQEPPRCGMCRGNLDPKKVLRMKLQAPEKREDQETAASRGDEQECRAEGVDFSKYGTKLKDLTLYVSRVTRADPSAKIILFVQFRRLAELVHRALSEFCVPLVRCRGNVMVRNRAVRDFKMDPKIKVIMLSSEDSVSGLHLTEANYVIILHPFMAESEATALAYERQGIARAVRAGQTREVRVVRFVARETVEERITTMRGNIQNFEHGGTAGSQSAPSASTGAEFMQA